MSRDTGAPDCIRIGPAGWSYQDWTGQVYPTPQPREFDSLTYHARSLDVIGINASCDRTPEVTTTRRRATRASGC
jgi:uncharacterized protein YecE (DUF72 family)